MANVTNIGIDNVATQGAATNSQLTSTSGSGFDQVIGATQYAAGVAGPVAYASTNYLTGGSATSTTDSAMIIGAAVNAAAGNPYATTSLSAGVGYSGSTGAYLSPYGGASYQTTDTSSMSGNVEGILSESAASQAYLIGIQMQMGTQQVMYTSISNALNVKHGMEKSVINNFKA